MGEFESIRPSTHALASTLSPTFAAIARASCDESRHTPSSLRMKAFAQPADMEEAEFRRRVAAICAWFNVLNPYEGAGELLKREDANFELVDGRPTNTLAPLYVLAISAKRYALFNIDVAGKPVRVTPALGSRNPDSCSSRFR